MKTQAFKTAACLWFALPIILMGFSPAQGQSPPGQNPEPTRSIEAPPHTEIYPDSFEGEAITISAKVTIPASLPWPVASKSVKDVSLFFSVEDSVAGVAKTCKRGICGAASGTSELHYPNHLGIDIAATPGTKVQPVASGCVEFVAKESSGTWKWYVVLSHGPSDGKTSCPNKTNTWTTVYWHLDNIDTSKISAGKMVTTSSILGEVADLDNTKTGDIDHLHFGIRAASYDLNDSRRGYAECTDSTARSFVNPLSFLKRSGTTLVDDNNASLSGTWTCSNALPFYYGTGYRWIKNSASGSATYNVGVAVTGKYKIYARWWPFSDRTSKAVFTLTHGTRVQTTTKDQTTGSGQWTELATMDLTMSVPLVVTIRNGLSSGYLIADAILIERQ